MDWQNIKNKEKGMLISFSKVFFILLFFLIIFLIFVSLKTETKAATSSCGRQCYSNSDCPTHHMWGTSVCCYQFDICGLAPNGNCMYYQQDGDKPTCASYCEGGKWYFNGKAECTASGWQCSYLVETCLSCGCCDGLCSAAAGGCYLNENDANCPTDGWVNVGSTYDCCDPSDPNRICTCQDQQYRDYYCSSSDPDLCTCRYNVTGTRTVRSNCRSCGTAGSWSTCSNCSYSSVCANSGTGTQSRTIYVCVDNKCVTSSESRECTCTRNTDGDSCGTPGSWSTCSNCSYPSTCAESGTGTQSRTIYVCSGGECVTSSESRECTCTRNTDGKSCGTSACPDDTCTGDCPRCSWRDYPDSCTRYCKDGSCQTCTCSYTDRDPDHDISYCQGCNLIWDSATSKCCGDDGGATDTWCNTGNGSCVGGFWYPNHCSDGIQNCDETGIDIGGSCGCDLNRTGNFTINFSCVLEGTNYLQKGNLTITTDGNIQMNPDSLLYFNTGYEIKIEGSGYILMGSNAKIEKVSP